MKKIILALAIIFATSYSFAQLEPMEKIILPISNQEVASIIAMSKDANKNNGVVDPNKIYIGQNLTFLFKDGYTGNIVVEKNDNQWKILKGKLAPLVIQHGDVVPFIDNAGVPEKNEVKPDVVPTPVVETAWYYTEGGLAAMVIGLILLIALLVLLKRSSIKDYFAERRQSNFATDNPMVAGGVSDSDAVRHMDRVAQRANVTRFGPVTKGRLSTFYRLRVMFANGGRKMRLTNAHVFMSQARRNTDNSECWIAYVQTCGNDASIIDMNRATFVADQVQSPDLRAANQPVASTNVALADQPTVFSGNAADLATIIGAVTSPMNGKDNGELEIEFSGIKIKMNFSSGAKNETLLLASGNGVKDHAKEQVAEETTKQ